jgi:enoyl-CoA hydratase
LTGAGDKAFVAGADISEMSAKSASEGVSFAQLGHEVTKLLELMPKPTIAAVNGFALGGGTELAISCDLIVASEKAVFGQPEVALGVIPGFGATVRLAKFVGMPRAKELIFSGRRVKADEAMRIGLVIHDFSVEAFWSEVVKLAEQMSGHSASAIRQAKKLLNEFSETAGLNYKLDSEAMAFGNLFGSFDQREGMSAFLEKRKPQFKGVEIL